MVAKKRRFTSFPTQQSTQEQLKELYKYPRKISKGFNRHLPERYISVHKYIANLGSFAKFPFLFTLQFLGLTKEF